jgi:hypothetical protein
MDATRRALLAAAALGASANARYFGIRSCCWAKRGSAGSF